MHYKKNLYYGWLTDSKRKKLTPKQLYYKQVKEYTELNKHMISGIEKRGYYSYHIDHKVPISVGYKSNIDPKLIADPSNLHMMPYKENMRKRDSIILDSDNNWLHPLI